MGIFDAVLLVALSGFVFYGLYFGLIRTLGSIVGILFGAFIASRTYLIVYDWLQPLAFGHDNIGKVVSFIICFTIINRLIGLVFAILDRTFNLLSIIPFLKTINRLAGAVFGFVEGALIIGLVLYVASRYALIGHWFANWLVGSKIAPFLLDFVKVIIPLLPEALKVLKSVI